MGIFIDTLKCLYALQTMTQPDTSTLLPIIDKKFEIWK